ncbi:MAG: gliding motility-associated C-terminal domain-containing protein [Bacteroidales bacterium]
MKNRILSNLRFPLLIGVLLLSFLSAFAQNIIILGGETNPFCGFAKGSIDLCYQNATDTCKWDIPSTMSSSFYPRGNYNDTITIYFNASSASGTIKVKEGSSGSLTATLALSLIKKANPAGSISLSGGLPFCEGINSLSVVKDLTDYSPSTLTYNWTLKRSDGTLLRNEINKTNNTFDVLLPADAGDGSFVVQPKTCDEGNTPESTKASTITLKPFILKNIFKEAENLQLHTLYLNRETTTPYWDILSANYACSYYSPEFSLQNALVNQRGKGDGFVYLQAGEYSKNDERSKYLYYEWVYDTAQLALDTRMSTDLLLRDENFGEHKSRISFKVKHGTTLSKDIKVSVKISCPDCINKAGSSIKPSDFKRDVSFFLKRTDSITKFQDFDIVANRSVCAGTENVFSVTTLDSRGFENSQATGYNMDDVPSWWKLVQQIDTAYTYITNQNPSLVPNTLGDSASVRVYPANVCFSNGYNVDRNGKIIKIFVKNKPLKPVLYDPSIKVSYEPHYTKYRREQLNILRDNDTNPVLICNANAALGFQKFILNNDKDSILSYGFANIDGLFDMNDIINLDATYKDSAICVIIIHAINHAKLQGKQLYKLGFYAQNACGIGDTGINYINIIDTLSVYSPIVDETLSEKYKDTLCEGVKIHLTNNTSIYNPSMIDVRHKVTDRIDYQWKLSPGWSFDPWQDSTAVIPNIKVGYSSGPVRLRLGNKCGVGNYLNSKRFVVHPFVRVKIEPDGRPCQGSTASYRFDTVMEAEGYHWSFPSDWKVVSTGTNEVETTNKESSDAGTKISTVDVRVGADSGYIYVVGAKDKFCGFTFNNYATHHRDSLKVLPKKHTLKPSMRKIWEDTLCARSSVQWSVVPNSQDLKDSVHFSWIFTNTLWYADTVFSKNKDTLTVRIPNKTHVRDSIRVVSHRYDCDQWNIGDTLTYVFWIMDTLSPVGPIIDANNIDAVLNHTPCQGDTVIYILDKVMQDPSLYYLTWLWNGGNVISGTDNIDASGWKILKNGQYKDTLALVVGKNPLTIGVRAVGLCGSSVSYTDTIKPISLVVDTASFTAFKNSLCNREEVEFTHQEVPNATNYIWHYSWDLKIDTVKNALNAPEKYTRKFKADFDTGLVYVSPYNSCGIGPNSDTVKISAILYPPKHPSLYDFAGKNYDPIRRDTAVDTICMRTNITLKARYVDAKQKDAIWRYGWFLLAGNAQDKIIPANKPMDSLCVFEKKAGFEKDFIAVAVRHDGCLTYGDSVYIELRSVDTVSVPDDKTITDYLFDAQTGIHIQPRPCGNDTVQYYFDWKMNPTITASHFIWNGKQLYNPTDSTMDGSTFKLLKIGSYDTLKMQVGNGSSLNVQVVASNRCGISTLPSITIATSTRILNVKNLSLLSKHICNKEKLILRIDTVVEAGNYIWHYPWAPYCDTVSSATRALEANFVSGKIWVEPNNGCGSGPASDTVFIAQDSILYPPKGLVPANFAFGYNPTLGGIATDTLCMNDTISLLITSSTEKKAPYHINWTLVSGDTNGFMPSISLDSMCEITQRDINQKAYRLQAAAKISYCKTYGDTLSIAIFPMDTISFSVDNTTGPFMVRTSEIVLDQKNGNHPISTSPCGHTESKYYFMPDIHWSLDTLPYFSWNGENYPRLDSSLAGTDWSCKDASLLPSILSVQVGNIDTLHLRVQLRNRCGLSVSSPMHIIPNSAVVDKAVVRLRNESVCLNEEAVFQINALPYANHYVWTTPWSAKEDTTTKPYLTVNGAGSASGNITVYGYNDCGAGPISDTFPVNLVLSVPKRPLPDWSPNLRMNGDTVFDTICLHGEEYKLRVRPNGEDTADVQIIYQWQKIKGSMAIMPDAKLEDSICVVMPQPSSLVNDDNLFMVNLRWKNCENQGDTLYIRIHLVDTVATKLLGEILAVTPNVFHYEPCPQTEISVKVENGSVSAAYQWILPDSWSFVSKGDTNAAEVKIITGSKPGFIQVAPITDAGHNRCNYFSANPVKTLEFRPHQPLQTEGFLTFVDSACVGSTVVYTLNSTLGAKAYRWEFPFGWQAENSDILEGDSIVSYGTQTCSVKVGSTSGKIKAYALDSCNKQVLVRGTLVEKEVMAMDTARLTIAGDINVCLDSMAVLLVTKNKFADISYDLKVEYKGPDLTPIEISFPSAPDSSIVNIKCLNLDTVKLIFTPHNRFCPNNILSEIHYIVADTIPTITGTIIGDSLVCMESLRSYTAKADIDDGSGVVKYVWELPKNSGWQAITRLDSSSILLRVGNYDGTEALEKLKCYPRALCGTANPLEYKIRINVPDTFVDEILVDNNAPCVSTNINMRLGNNYDKDTIQFLWTYPLSWTRLSVDSANAISFKVGLDSAEVMVQYLRKGSCGLSKGITTQINVRDSAARAYLCTQPYLCKTNEVLSFVIARIATIDSIKWEFPSSYTSLYEVFNRNGFIKNDSAVLVNSGLDSSFNIRVTSFNECGNRDTILNIRQVNKIDPFIEEIQQNHFCVEDTGYAYIKIPFGQRNKGTNYKWDLLFGDGQIINYYEDKKDTLAVVQFTTGVNADSLKIRLHTENDCGSIPDKIIKAVPFTYWIKAKAGKDTAKYMEKNLALNIDSVQYKSIRDYTYTWMPNNRIITNTTNPEAITFSSLELVQPIEYFSVIAREKEDPNMANVKTIYRSSSCFSYDTISIFVDSTFAMQAKLLDTACQGMNVALSVLPYGGNTNKYFFDWYRLQKGIYEKIEGWNTPTNTAFADDQQMQFMVVGRDSTYLYTPDGSTLILSTSKIDTQYMQVHAMSLEVAFAEPGKEQIKVPIGTAIKIQSDVFGGSGRYSYYWSPLELFNKEAVFQGNVQTKKVYTDCNITLMVRDTVSRCENKTVLQVLIGDEFGKIPNAFSPNGDGINDVFMRGVDLLIFNRFGLELFRSKNKEGWDGTYKGKMVSKGDYLYVITVAGKDGKTHTKKGVVSVF